MKGTQQTVAEIENFEEIATTYKFKQNEPNTPRLRCQARDFLLAPLY